MLATTSLVSCSINGWSRLRHAMLCNSFSLLEGGWAFSLALEQDSRQIDLIYSSHIYCVREKKRNKLLTWCSRAASFSHVTFVSWRPGRPRDAILAPPAIQPRLSFAPCTKLHDGSGENNMTPASIYCRYTMCQPWSSHFHLTVLAHFILPGTWTWD